MDIFLSKLIQFCLSNTIKLRQLTQRINSTQIVFYPQNGDRIDSMTSFHPMYKLCAVILVAGQRTHGTTFWALKVTSQVMATPGAESAVYDCVVEICERKTYRHTDRHRDTLIAILRSRSSNCESEYECGRECNMARL